MALGLIHAFRDAGWAAYKIHPPQHPPTDIKVCEAVRRAVGPRVDEGADDGGDERARDEKDANKDASKRQPDAGGGPGSPLPGAGAGRPLLLENPRLAHRTLSPPILCQGICASCGTATSKAFSVRASKL